MCKHIDFEIDYLIKTNIKNWFLANSPHLHIANGEILVGSQLQVVTECGAGYGTLAFAVVTVQPKTPIVVLSTKTLHMLYTIQQLICFLIEIPQYNIYHSIRHSLLMQIQILVIGIVPRRSIDPHFRSQCKQKRT